MKNFASLALLTLVSSCSAYPGLDTLNKRQITAFLKAKKSLNLPPPVNGIPRSFMFEISI